MGTFFSTVQIKNREKAEPEQFKKLLCRHLEKKGLLPAKKEDSCFSYYFVFSHDNEWVTLSSPNFEDEDFRKEMQKLSKSLKTVCVATSVFDSDTVMIDLFNSLNKQKDTVIIGHSDEWVENVIKTEKLKSVKGNQKYWESLLTTDKSWEELIEIWNDDYVFAEEALAKTAPFFGMDSDNIMADYRCFEEEPDKYNVFELHFKTTGEVFINEGLTKLCLYHKSFSVTGERHIVSFCNLGGVSKGVTVILLGECLKNNGVEISEMTVEKMKNPRSQEAQRHKSGEREIHSAIAQKFKMPDGTPALRFDFNDFQFHEGINQRHPSMKGIKGDNILSAHVCHLRFTPTKKLAEKQYLRFAVIPLNNWEAGQTSYKMVVYDTREQLMKESPDDFRIMEYYGEPESY